MEDQDHGTVIPVASNPGSGGEAYGDATFVFSSSNRFALRTISDDGVRVCVEGKLVIDRWDVRESIVDAAPIGAGRRALRVEYFEHVGWAELRVEIVKPWALTPSRTRS